MSRKKEAYRYIAKSLDQLKDFQRATVDVCYDWLFKEGRSRMLVADEVGLGKTIVAKGVIARRLKAKLDGGDDSPLRVTYICSNQIIGWENVKKLDLYPNQESYDSSIDRLAYLAYKPDLTPGHLLWLNTLTPGTSFEAGERPGKQDERKLLYTLLMSDQEMLAPLSQGLACLLRGGVQLPPDEWAEHLEAVRVELAPDIRDDLPARFLNAIQTIQIKHSDAIFTQLRLSAPIPLYDAVYDYGELLTFANYKKHRPASLELIRQLRKTLASLCIDYIYADLYILDEFQRFRDLIDEESESEAATIAKQIFKKPHTKILLLSATPFKAFTGDTDVESGEDHYKEFRTVLAFLLEYNRQALDEYETHRRALFKQLLNLRADVSEIDTTHRDEVQATLRRVMCRTERLSVSEDHDAMTEDKYHNQPVTMTAGDIENFIATDGLVETLNRTIEQPSQQLHSPVEFCKSAPFPLSFLDDYKLKRVLKAKKDDPDVRSSLDNNPRAWLDHKKIGIYKMVVGGNGSSFANAKLTQLVDEALSNNAECLLWVPPSLPYYPLSGVYADSAGFSKTLVFSAWLMVPRMLASLISYEVERRTIGNRASVEPQEQGRRRLYFAPDRKRHPVPQLVYRMEGEEPSNMTNFTLLYPSLTLAALFDPLAVRLSGKSQAVLEDELQAQVAALVGKLQLRQYEQADGEPDRWYWAGPVLLDKLSAHYSSVADEWLHSEEIDSTSFSTDKDAGDTSKGQHFDRLVQAFDSPHRIGLGPIPGDFPRVMAEMALGSPAIVALRSFSRLYGEKTWAKCVSALSVANEFVNLFNKPESVAAVRIAVRERQYWRKVLRYCRDGCLQAVLDEYLHLLKAECETVPEAVDRLNPSINIKTTNLKVDDLEMFLQGQQKTMRCHFAVDFGNQRIETEAGSERIANVRQNFNSPFRPFVLATTSIGQEGLDFHQYCRKVVHWNLPSNPIDLEQREGRINRFKGLVIRQQIAHKYGPLLTVADVQSKDLWDDLFRIAEFMERDGKPYCQLVPFWHVDTTEAKSFKIDRIIPFYPFSRDRAKLSSILRTLAIYRLAFGQPRQSELIEHLLKHLPEDKIGAVREKLMVNLSPISYRTDGTQGEPNEPAAVQVRAEAKGDSGESPSPALQPPLGSSITSSLGMRFVWIPPGTFTMGSPTEEADRVNNETPHKVTLTKGFYLGVQLVTQQQWQAVMGKNPSRFKGETNLPVEGVSWEDCQEFIRKVQEKENRHYRLPTEAEWEYACRAGTKTPFNVGFQLFPGQANFLGRQATPIGSFRPNAFGLHDMHGNLYEWCQDWYAEYPENAVVDPQGPPVGTERVVRGGCWGLGPPGCRSAYRRHFQANRRSDCFGFRLVLCSE